jgi:hypothetical protein
MQRSNKLLPLGFMMVAVGLGAGCGGSDEPADTAGATVAQPVTEVMAVQVAPPSPVAPPPGTPVAALPMGTAPNEPKPIANDGSLASYVTGRASAYFQDGEGEFDVASAQEVVERAIVAYREIQSTKHDDSPDWPVFNDLSLLVKYKILRALPPAPEGQRFVYDAATRKVQLAAN